MSSALRTGRLYPRRNPLYSFLETESTPGHMVLLVAMEKIPSDTTGNRSRDLRLVAQCLNHYLKYLQIMHGYAKRMVFRGNLNKSLQEYALYW